MRRNGFIVVAVVASLIAAAACSSTDTTTSDPTTVGFVFVGTHDDLGYNQAAWEASESLARAYPDLTVLRVEDVPETDEAASVMEDLIDQGATILFATSFGYGQAAYDVARRHPGVTVVHQGGLEPAPRLENFGTYFGTHSEAMYLAGMTAGAATSSNRVGFVAAFPIPATYMNVNAFTLGAQAVKPEVTTLVRFTADWCDVHAQAQAAAALIDAGVDVLAQHQDCTRTILEAAESAGIYAVGYHADGSEVAPTGWLTGAVWVWDDLFIDIVRTALAGTFSTSKYSGDYLGSMAGDDNPFILTEPGPSVSADTIARLRSVRERFVEGGSPFDGPVVDRDGTTRIGPGAVPTVEALDSMDWFVQGVIGDTPSGSR